MRNCCSYHLVFSDHQKFRFPLLQRWIRCTFSQVFSYVQLNYMDIVYVTNTKRFFVFVTYTMYMYIQEKRTDFTQTSGPKQVNRMVIFLGFLYGSYTRLFSTKEAGNQKCQWMQTKGPQNRKIERKDPQNRKGTAPQDRKPSDNYYSAPATYHRKKTVASLSNLPAKFEWGAQISRLTWLKQGIPMPLLEECQRRSNAGLHIHSFQG